MKMEYKMKRGQYIEFVLSSPFSCLNCWALIKIVENINSHNHTNNHNYNDELVRLIGF